MITRIKDSRICNIF